MKIKTLIIISILVFDVSVSCSKDSSVQEEGSISRTSNFTNENMILFSSNNEGRLDLYFVDTQQADSVRLTNSKDVEFTPRWSPNCV